MEQQSSYTLQNDEHVQIIQVQDLLNEYENKKILDIVHQKMEEGFPDFVVDLSLIDYMNSVGLNFLISIKNRSESLGGKIAVAHASQKIVHLLEMTKLKPLFHLEANVADAIGSLRNV